MIDHTKKTITEQEALFKATTLCAQCEQCEYNIREKLHKWGIEEATCNRIIDFLYDEKYLDESRFANAYARSKMRFNHWGRRKIEQGMRLLHIDSSACRDALSALPEEEYEQILKDLLSSKARNIRAESTFERNGKLIRFAIGRGFEMELIMRFLPDGADSDEDYFDLEDQEIDQ